VTDKVKPFNPLDRKNLGASVAEALLEKEPVLLGQIEHFTGAGVYAIYYSGTFPCYEPLAEANSDRRLQLPIYVGKAIPEGARKGGVGLGDDPGYVLRNRLRQHARSVEQAENLNLGDFHCRYLVVEDIWIPLGESLLIAKFSPIWNMLIDGYGNHDPGKGRYNQLRSRWDVLHPGRAWAEKCAQRLEKADQIAREVADYLRSRPPPERAALFVDDQEPPP
jgi:hypothetical protein